MSGTNGNGNGNGHDRRGKRKSAARPVSAPTVPPANGANGNGHGHGGLIPGGPTTSAPRLAAAEKKRQVYELRLASYSFRRISAETGVSLGRCHEIVDTELKRMSTELSHDVEKLRALDLARCDTALLTLFESVKEARGRPAVLSPDGQRVVVPEVLADLRAVATLSNAIARMLERRAKLAGLDKPTQIDVRHPDRPFDQLGDEDLERELRRVQDELALGLAARADGPVH